MFIHMNIADLHGITHPNPKVFYELELSFILEYIKYNEVHLLTFSGDTFHKLFTGDSEELKYMILFFKELATLCKEKNILLRIIRGTLSHEKDQLNLLKFCLNMCDCRFIEENVEYEHLDNGLIVRYIPEPYGDHILFNESIKEELAHITVFHGTIMGVEYHIDKAYKPSDKGSILIDPKLLNDYTEFYTIGGHFHNRGKYYTGSYSSNTFEDANEKKGFDIFKIDSSKIENIFITNPNHRKFIIKDFTKDILTKHIDTIKKDISLMFGKLGVYDKLRLDIDITNLETKKINEIHLLQNTFKEIHFKLIRNIKEDESSLRKKEEVYEDIFKKDIKEIIFTTYKNKGGKYDFNEVNNILMKGD